MNKSNTEKSIKVINNSNPSKINNIKPNINLHTSNPEKNKLLNSNQKIKQKESIISQKHNSNNKMNNSSQNQNKIKKPENIKIQSHKINNISQKNNTSTKNEHIHKHPNDNINKNKIKTNNNINNNHYSNDSKKDKIKNPIESRKSVPNVKMMHQEKMRDNFSYNKHRQMSSKRYFFEGDDYDEDDPFIDNTDYRDDNHKEVMNVLKNFKNYQDMKKKNEVKGDIEVANYDTIQEEEDRTRRIGRQEDYEALIENRRLEEDEEEEEDEDDY